MNRLFLLFILWISFVNVQASISGDSVKPFVGKWGYWKGDCYYELELSLYDIPVSGNYGMYSDFCGDTSEEFPVVDVISIQNNVASVIVETYNGKSKALLECDPISKKISLKISGFAPLVFNHQDKFGFVCIRGGDKVNVRAVPVSGTPLLKADRGQSFKFLGKEQGWFKVELSELDRRVGYISPEYGFYLKENDIPEDALSKSYSNGPVSIEFSKKGNQVMMLKTTMRPLKDGSFLPALVENYLGRKEGNALIFTYFQSGYIMELNVEEMSKIDPYVIYYQKDPGMFIMEGKNYSVVDEF